jgi:FMNH2-dependent dimethyl sulfone monooxygenase
MVTVVQRDTLVEAEAYLQHYAVDHADNETIDAWLGTLSTNSKGMAQADMVDRRMRAAAGNGGTLLVGDANSIAEQMAALFASGIDGLLISWATSRTA